MNSMDMRQPHMLRKHVEHLSCRIGERHLWHNGSLDRAADYIESNFAMAGYAPTRQAYQAFGKTVANVIAEKKGTEPETIVIGAHYDSVPGSPGADDNASAVAGLLELARLMEKQSCRCSLTFAAFVNEESPSFGSDYMGSMQYARYLNEIQKPVRYMICLESIGYFKKDRPQKYPLNLLGRFYPKHADFIGVVGDFASIKHVFRMVRSIKRYGEMKAAALVAPRQFGGIDRSDHRAFWQSGYNAFMITDTANFRNPHYHKETDTIDTLDFEMMSRVVAGIYGALLHMP